MLDNLKDYIDQSRESFELYPFEEKNGWEKIATQISPPKKRSNRLRIITLAACLSLFVVSGVLFVSTGSNESGELAEMESYYKGEIDQRVLRIKNHLGDDQVLQDLAVMDQAFAELKNDLKDNLDNEEVITAMMANYQMKLHILEEMLKELEKEKREEVL